jgi:hypothetical protein
LSLAFFKQLPQYSWPVAGDGTRRLYQWLSRQTSFFRFEVFGSGVTRTVRTEVTVERRAMAVLASDLAGAGFDTCPLCGNKLTAEHPKHGRAELSQGSILEGAVQIDRPPT